MNPANIIQVKKKISLKQFKNSLAIYDNVQSYSFLLKDFCLRLSLFLVKVKYHILKQM